MCRYDQGQHFGKHVDDSVTIGPGLVTQYTLLIYLTGSCKQSRMPASLTELRGGETVFYGKAVSECAGTCTKASQSLMCFA